MVIIAIVRQSLFPANGENSMPKTNLQRQMDATDEQIDNLVYELYELTPEEIKIVAQNLLTAST
jgi:hypothetical protein